MKMIERHCPPEQGGRRQGCPGQARAARADGHRSPGPRAAERPHGDVPRKEYDVSLLPKTKIEVVVTDNAVDSTVKPSSRPRAPAKSATAAVFRLVGRRELQDPDGRKRRTVATERT